MYNETKHSTHPKPFPCIKMTNLKAIWSERQHTASLGCTSTPRNYCILSNLSFLHTGPPVKQFKFQTLQYQTTNLFSLSNSNTGMTLELKDATSMSVLQGNSEALAK